MNEDQSERWNGPDADHWCDNADRYDSQLAPFLDAIVATARIDDEAVLDVGCGCGALSIAVAASSRRVVGLDISSRLLAVARDRIAGGAIENIDFVAGDAQTWTDAQPFDVIVSRFGLMFFDDPERAFTNLRANLHTSGRIVFACWQGLGEQEWLLAPAIAAAPFLEPGTTPPVSGPGMFALAEPGVVESLLTTSGFGNVQLTDLRTSLAPGGPGTVAEAVDFFAATGFARTMLDHATPEARAGAIAAATKVFADHHDGTSVRMNAAAWIVTANAQ